MWDFEEEEKPSVQRVKECGIRWIWLNGKWVRPVPEDFALQELTGVGLDLLNTHTPRLLGRGCPRLEVMQVGCKYMLYSKIGFPTPTLMTIVQRQWLKVYHI